MILVPMRIKPFVLVEDFDTKEVMSCHVGDVANSRGVLWVTASEYVSSQYVQNVGWLKKSCRLSK